MTLEKLDKLIFDDWKTLKLSDKMFYITCIAGTIINFLAMLVSILFSPHSFFITFVFGIIFVFIYLIFRIKKIQLRMLSCYLIILFISLSWFFNAGFNGGAQYFLIYGFLVPILLLNGRKLFFTLAACTLSTLFLVFIEYFYPNIAAPYADRTARYIDIALSMAIAITGITCIYKLSIIFINREMDEINTTSRQLQQNNAELSEARIKAEKSNKIKSNFLSNMSHEIRTPLNGVIGMSELLKETNLDDEQAEMLDSILISGRNLLKIINDILDITKIEAGKMVLINEPFNLKKETEALAECFEIQAKFKKLRFICTISDELNKNFIGDSRKLIQVLTNLLDNAVKFTETGEVRLDIHELSRIGNESTINFIISDTGIGIPQDKIEHVFDSFVQGDSSSTKKYSGIGLGLTICKNNIGLLGGTFEIHSTEGKGTESIFTIKLKTDSTHKKEESVKSTNAALVFWTEKAQQSLLQKTTKSV